MTRNLRSWLYRRVGQRRAVLAVFSTAWVGYGSALLIASTHERFSRPGASPLDPLDSRWWGLLWIACGITVIAIMVRNRNRDVPAFAAIITPALTWALFYAWSMLADLASSGEFGESDAWVGLLHWLMLTVIIWLVAGWPDQFARSDPPQPTG